VTPHRKVTTIHADMYVALDYREDILLRKASFYKLMVFTLWFLTALCLLAPVRPAAALNILPYTITDLGFRSRGPGPFINNNSQVAGSRSISGQSQALLWENGNITDLGTLPGNLESRSSEISDTGQIVGTSDSRAFLWENGVMTGLGTLPGNTISEALGVNNFGQVVGGSQGGSSNEQAFIWENGVMTGLGTLGGTTSKAEAINDLEQVAGFSRTASGVNHPFLWENGNMVDLGVITGTASPQDINNAGKVVGQGDNLANNNGRALLWENGNIVNLGILPGHTGSSIAFAINNNNQIVGNSSGRGGISSFLGLSATFWQNGAIFNLNNLLLEDNWSLLSATDINYLGEIVGNGINPNGDITTFLLKPVPEPSTLLLLASGLAGLAAWRRRKTALPALFIS